MKKTQVTLAVLLGIIFFGIGFVYITHAAGSLPHYFPGYTAGLTTKHFKHGLAAFIVGLVCFIYAWFKSAPQAA